MSTPAEPAPPLAPDDPRLSEWIDGRLSAAEAAAVEQAVDRSPELARLVADLRAIKAAARATAAASPPPGFADRVMAAVVADKRPPGDAASDRLVDAEWRAIEAERIAEERAEAAADLADEIAPARVAGRRPWPWLTIATALAAGLLATVVLNFPPRGPDEVQVALVTDREQEPIAQNGALQNRALRRAAEREALAAPAPAAAVAAREPQRPAEESRSRDKAAELAEPIEVMVRGPDGRAKLLQRLTVLGLAAVPAGAEVLELVGSEEAVAAFLADPVGEQPLAEGLLGPGEADLLASEAGDGEAKPAGSDRRRGEQRSAAGGLVAAETSGELARATPGLTEGGPSAPDPRVLAAAAPRRRILIRVVELQAAAGEPSQP